MLQQPLSAVELPKNAIVYTSEKAEDKYRALAFERDPETGAWSVRSIAESEVLSFAVEAVYEEDRPAYVPIEEEIASAVGTCISYLEPDAITLTEALEAALGISLWGRVG